MEPLYTTEDAEKTLRYLAPCEYGEIVQPAPGVKFRFTDAGHLLGSASVELWATKTTLRKDCVLRRYREPASAHHPGSSVHQKCGLCVDGIHYGNREHEKREDYIPQLAEIIDRTLREAGIVIIPSFAVGRTQELLYFYPGD